jgi:serine protease AprX
MGVCSRMDFPLLACRMRWMSAAAVSGVLVLSVIVALGITADPGLSLAPASGGAHATAREKVGSSLAAMAADRPEKRSEVIVRMQPGVDPSAGRELVHRAGGKAVSRDLPIINGFGAKLKAGEAARLARDSRVLAVSENGGVRTRSELPLDTERASTYTCPPSDATTTYSHYPTQYGRDASVNTAMSRLEEPRHHSMNVGEAWYRATGRGVGVAVVDTGIAGELVDFRATRGSRASRVVASAVTNPCAKESTDNYGHGTHVAGLIAGNSLMREDDGDMNYGRYMGIAPNANLISVKVSDEDGATTVLDVIHGLQFVVDHRADYNIRVVNLSLSSTVAESYRTDPLDAAAEQAWFQGIVVVAAAGNEGNASDAVSFAPGNDPFVISAGSVDDQGTRTRYDDALAGWSSRGTTQDGFRKPEVLAPGAHLTSTLARNSDFQSLCAACVKRYRYFQAGGTSMSAAVVSGVAALLIEEHPDWTPKQVKGALMSTLRDVPGAGGMVNAYAAMNATSLSSNADLAPNDLIAPATGLIDYTRASFRRASFRDASGSPLDATWSRASFRCDCGLLESGGIDPTRASFRRASFRKTLGFHK